MRIYLLISCTLTITACTAAGSPAHSTGNEPSAPAPSESRTTRSFFGFPATFPDLSMGLVDVHEYENPRLGSRLTYVRRTPALTVHVYVYPMAPPEAVVPDTVRRRLVRQMFEQGQEDIREYERRGRYSEVRFSEDAQLRLPSRLGPVEGWGSTADMLLEGEPVHSRLYLFTLANTYVKFRATYPRDGGQEVGEIIEEFVAAFLAEANPGAAPATTPVT